MSFNRGRKRNALLGKIRQQMEFYFSDASLTKDRFLQERIQQSEDEYVPVSLFLTFNKVRAMTADESLIREAVRTSALLQLSEDGTKLKRRAPINSDLGPVDARTLYVENLPLHVDHEWLKSKFSVFGPVQYISLPKFKALKTIKGFAFIEFDSPDAVQKACEYFSAPPTDSQPLFAKESALPTVPTVTVHDFDEDEISAAHGTKRRRDDVDADAQPQSDTVPVEPKRQETEPPPSSKTQYRLQTKPKGTAGKPKATAALDLRPLKVMPKTQWMELKQRYLELQRASYRAIKQKLKMMNVADDEEDGIKEDAELMMESDEDMSESEAPMKRPQKPKFSKPVNPPTSHVKPAEKSILFRPGAILHWVLSTAMEDRKKFIQDVRTIPHVEFVDVQSPTEVYVRCDNADGVKEVSAALTARDGGNVIRLLEGDEEKGYWVKIENDMEKRSAAAKNRRGKAKVREGNDVVAKAEAQSEAAVKKDVYNRLHIKFE